MAREELLGWISSLALRRHGWVGLHGRRCWPPQWHVQPSLNATLAHHCPSPMLPPTTIAWNRLHSAHSGTSYQHNHCDNNLVGDHVS
ncbi:hypothetical protein BS78_K152700 [Paspalum vaginatum]|uniref:Uncharacterized protein n=1 Tax=Paspalum vaginatum TaxID=158149 RepID=A0A9W7XCL8_9POAL|nr:hypothetical protein BS78_K152700 [Paspalum vaginatum]